MFVFHVIEYVNTINCMWERTVWNIIASQLQYNVMNTLEYSNENLLSDEEEKKHIVLALS